MTPGKDHCDFYGSWLFLVKGREAISRHFDTASSIDPVVLADLKYDGRLLDLVFVSFQPPVRYAEKWQTNIRGGTKLTLTGSSRKVVFANHVLLAPTNITTCECEIDGVINSPGGLIEREFKGVSIRLTQGDTMVVEAKCSDLRLTSLFPISDSDARYYRNPNRYT